MNRFAAAPGEAGLISASGVRRGGTAVADEDDDLVFNTADHFKATGCHDDRPAPSICLKWAAMLATVAMLYLTFAVAATAG